MATAQASPPPPAAPVPPVARPVAPAARPQSPQGADQPGTSQALVPVSPPTEQEQRPLLEGPIARLPVEVDVVVPIEEFRVRNLLALEPGKVIQSQWNYGEDVPLSAGDVQLAWTEFEVIDGHLAVRITRLPCLS